MVSPVVFHYEPDGSGSLWDTLSLLVFPYELCPLRPPFNIPMSQRLRKRSLTATTRETRFKTVSSTLICNSL